MKLKMIAAAALASVSMASHAGINATDDGSEFILVVWDSAGSYVKDLGITMGSVLAGSASAAGYSFSFAPNAATDTAWSQMLGADGVLAADTRWLILAADSFGDLSPGLPGSYRLVSSLGTNALTNASGGGDWRLGMDTLTFQKFAEVNFTGTHTVNPATNGSSYNPLGTPAYFAAGPDVTTLVSVGFDMSRAIGQNSFIGYTTTVDEFDDTLPISVTRLGNAAGFAQASFDGTTLNYAVAAVPEPGSIAMMLAGLGALGFVGRRRRLG